MSEIDQHSNVPRIFPSAPRIGVGVVVFKDSKFVLVQREKHPGKGEWSIPGGVIELGETVHHAAHREIQEECNLEIERLAFLDVFEYIEKEDNKIKFHYIVLDYVAQWKSGILFPGSDAPNANWFEIADLDNLFIKPQTIAIIKKAMTLTR